MKNPIAATLFAVVLAVLVNIYYYLTGSELTEVISKTLFADLILVLSLVPVYQAIVVRNSSSQASFPEQVKSGMKPVVMYTFLIAVATYVLFSMFGDPLVGEKIYLLSENAKEALEAGEITEMERQNLLDMTQKFYSISFYLPILLLSNLFVGFISSILAGLLVRK